MPPHKCFAQQNLEIDGIHFRRFEFNLGPRTALPSGDELKQKLLELRG